jgi:uroporphyrinogen decarboxylase
MNNRQITLDTIRHKQCDQVPYQLDLTSDMEKKLIAELGPDFLTEIDNCFALERNEEFVYVDDRRRKDMFGAVWLLDQQGDFGVVENCMLPEPSLKGYDFPLPEEKLIREKCERLTAPQHSDKFSMYIIGFSLYERAWCLRGMENLLMDMVINPDFVEELFESIVDYNNAVSTIVMEYPVDAIFYGDDWGQQRGLVMGPDYWRKFIKPALGSMYSHVKDKGRYLCLHSCGDIHEVFSDLVDLGLDIYNTFQPEIYDVKKVKQEFGKDLTFYGGISTQSLLPFGTPDEVRKETREIMEIMGKDGGYVAAPTHSMPPDIPVENVQAFLDAVRNQR